MTRAFNGRCKNYISCVKHQIYC
ncbi:MAG: DUF4041 domain-containing protein [Endomicrobium sp.]|nr:DUF4041 domain-containing protein [Endomicrobium sp.]